MDHDQGPFLHLLNDSQLVAHINSISQASCRRSEVSAVSFTSSFDSDPFNDDLDSVLLKLNQPRSQKRDENKFVLSSHSDATLLSFEVCGNQLAAFETDEDDEKVGVSELERKPIKDRKNSFLGEDGSRNHRRIDENCTISMHDLSTKDGVRKDANLDFNNKVNENRKEEIFKKDFAFSGNIEASTFISVPSPSLAVSDPLEEYLLSDDENSPSNFGHVGAQHRFGDFRTYFDNKHRKQQLADRYLVSWERRRRLAIGDSNPMPTFFKNCIVFVNGSTAPSLAAIHKMVVLHGGVFLRYLQNKSSATHIVCDKLTPRKRIQFRNYRVVRARWIADCVEKQRLLDWREYRLIEDLNYDQQRLGFERINQETSKNEEYNLFEEEEENFLLESDSVAGFGDLDNLEEMDADRMVLEEMDLQKAEPCEEPLIETTSTSKENISQLQISRPRRSYQMDAKHPEFLTHFFANSRLHHLSKWKADLRAKFIRLVANQLKRTRNTSTQRLILHIDFDCFFAAVSTLNHPNIDIDKHAVAVSHGGKSSDVASCNYVARKKGVKNGMWLGKASTLCPELKVIDYDFDACEKASRTFYTYLVSCDIYDSIFPVLIDEALVDVSTHCSKQEVNVQDFLQKIRGDIFHLTGCSVSIGAAENVLLAKLATKQAKPKGQYYLHGDTTTFLSEINVLSLPGLGRRICRKLAEETGLSDSSNLLIKDIRSLSLQKMTRALGEATGLKLYNFCRGIDATSVELDTSSCEALLGRKTVSVEVNFGIRFDTFPQVETFLMNVAKELQIRMARLGVCGSRLSLKLARRHPNSPVNPPKYLGMGHVDFFTRTSNLGIATSDWGLLGSEMKALYRSLNIPPEELRGVGVTMAKLADMEVVRKENQQKLQFKQRKSPASVAAVQSSQSFPFAEKVVNSESIDWEVFGQLPDSIKQEFKRELLRRGIPVSSNERSPSKDKKNSGKKVFLQQLFPSQPFGSYKSVKVIESPKKKRRKESPVKVVSVRKEESPTPYNDTISYDEDILNEIPSSIRNEFIADCERQQKNKRLAFVSMREKLEKKAQSRRTMEQSVIDRKWIATQKRLVELPTVPGFATEQKELLSQLALWILLSVKEQGPHPDDVQMFEEFLQRLLEQKMYVRAVGLIQHMEQQVDVEAVKSSVCGMEGMNAGIEKWRDVLGKLEALVEETCVFENMTFAFN